MLPWIAIALLLPAPAFGGRHGLSTTTENDAPITDCDQIKFSFHDEDDALPIARGERQIAVTASEARPLAISLRQGNGVVVHGGAREDVSITACMAAGGRSLESARRALDGIRVEATGGRITASAGAEDDWVVFLIVRAPVGAAVDLTAENGPIDVRGMTGSVVAHSENGPVSLEACSGQVEVNAHNGPVSTEGGGGKQVLRAENGPIAIDLSGRSWEGPGLEAYAHNGPVSLTLPGGYGSGVRIETSAHSLVSCIAGACRDARRTRDDEHRRIEFGDDQPAVRVSAENGPVAISSRGVEL